MAPQSAETTRKLQVVPVPLEQIYMALAEGDLPNPCYLWWDGIAMLKVWDDGENHVDVQVCNLTEAQTPDACYPYVCSSVNVDNVVTISRSFTCRDETDVESDLLDIGLRNVRLVDNSEDWFPRLQYYFSL